MRFVRSEVASMIAAALVGTPALARAQANTPELYPAVLDKFPEFGPARQNLAKVQKSGD